MSLTGPIVHERFFRQWNLIRMIAVYLLITCIAGILLIIFGSSNAICFALFCVPMSYCLSALRPSSTVLMMQQLNTDNGTVTALINSGGLLCGSLAMFMCVLPFWESAIIATGISCCIVGLITLIAWLYLTNKNLILNI